VKPQNPTTPPTSFLNKNRTNLFYILAFIPLLLVTYYNPFSTIIPLYGYLLLLIKQQNLTDTKAPSTIQRITGLIVTASSFFASYAVSLIYPRVAFYGVGNYVILLIGLLLTFFNLSAMKEAFSPVFLIVAATSSTFFSEWLRPYLSPFASPLAYLIMNILRTLGVNAYMLPISSTPTIAFQSLSGDLMYGVFAYECIGVYSMLVFSIILIVILLEDPANLKTRLAYSIIGLTGILILNVLRVTIIFLADYYYGTQFGGNVHYIIGYTLFSTWLIVFLYIYAKRQTTQGKITSLWNKILHKPNSTIKKTQETAQPNN
jgi:exosortase/archaeosortase family protein